MTDDDKSLGDDATLGGENAEREIDAQSLGDQSTHGDHSQMDSVGDSSSLGDQLTFGGDASGRVVQDDMEIVDLESRYTIERVLGKGGMGEVLLATDTRLERKVAIKRILGKAARSKTAVNRFLTEAKSVAAINHPNIVQIHDYGRDKQGPFLIMEYVAGQTLLDRCQQGAIALKEAIELTVQLCDGLAAAHDAHIVHRDVKPANILLTKNNIPKLTDFGLAKAEAADTGMTMAGAVLGTLDFMPPEQRKDAALVDARSDLWSLAATLYQMVTGKSPKIIKFNDVPQSLQDVLGKALEDKKSDRYDNAREFKETLLAIQTNQTERFELEEGDCPHCGTKNPTTRKFCRNPDCTESLEVPCLACKSIIPMWEQVCDACGNSQRELLENRRNEIATAKAEAAKLLRELDFEKSQRVALAIRDETDLRLLDNKDWAKAFLEEIEKVRLNELKRAAELMDEALMHEQAHDYSAALRTLKPIPQTVALSSLAGHDQPVKETKDRLQAQLDTIQKLDKKIRLRVKTRDLNNLLEDVECLQQLQPNKQNLEKLANQLRKRNEKLTSTRDKAWTAAQKRFGRQDYDGCLAQLNRIDVSLIDEDTQELERKAEETRTRYNGLRKTIDEAVDSDSLNGLLPIVEQCVALQRDAEDLQKLREKLVEREKENTALANDALQRARNKKEACQFEEALGILNEIDNSAVTEEVLEVLYECQTLNSHRTRALQALQNTADTRGSKTTKAKIQPYQYVLDQNNLVDAEFDLVLENFKGQLKTETDAEQIRKKRRKLILMLSAIGSCLTIGILSFVFWSKSPTAAAKNSNNKTDTPKPNAFQPKSSGPADNTRITTPVGDLPSIIDSPFDAEQAKALQQEWSTYLGQPTKLTNQFGMDLALIPSGRFEMGSAPSAFSHQPNEGPVHSVTISKPFYMAVTEVTAEQWQRIYYNNDQGGKWDQPQNCNWERAVEFCEKLSLLENRKYRLPTEAEWEYACRAGTSAAFSFGNDPDKAQEYGWGKENSGDKAHPVRQKLCNAFGLYDMHGNVREWCLDIYSSTYYTTSPSIDPLNGNIDTKNSRRVYRGGNFESPWINNTSAFRFGDDQTYTNPTGVNGFRVVLEIDTPMPDNPATKDEKSNHGKRESAGNSRPTGPLAAYTGPQPVAFHSFDQNAAPNYSAENIEFTEDRFGHAGGAIKFSPLSVVRTRNMNFGSDNDAKTVAVWIKTKEPETMIWSFGPPNMAQRFLMTKVGETIAKLGKQIISTKTICDGKWHHIVVSYDGTKQCLFIDGKLDSQSSGGPKYPAPSYGVLGIGSGHDDAYSRNGLKSGSIDDFMFFNTALTNQQVEELYESQFSDTTAEKTPPDKPLMPQPNDAISADKKDTRASASDSIDFAGLNRGLLAHFPLDLDNGPSFSSKYKIVERDFSFSKNRFGNSSSALQIKGNLEGFSILGKDLAPTSNGPPKTYSFWFNNHLKTGTNFLLCNTDGWMLGIATHGSSDVPPNIFKVYGNAQGALELPFLEKNWDKWNHAVFSFDAKGFCQVWINGELLGQGKINLAKQNSPVVALKVGPLWDRKHSYSMDELRIYNRTLDPEEIKSLYNYESDNQTNQ